MGCSVRVPKDMEGCHIWFWHVEEGQSVAPGAPLVDLMERHGLVVTISAESWGVVGHGEGLKDQRAFSRMSDASNDSFYMGHPYHEGDIICHIEDLSQRSTKGADLRPRQAPALRLIRGMPPLVL